MPHVVRLGVVGAGALAQRGILPHLGREDVRDRVCLEAVCNPVPGIAGAAERFGVERAFTDYEEMLEHGEVDAMTIASPIGLHHEQGMLALRAGKHVHLNKTMSTTVAEATELIAEARAGGLKIVASPGEMLLHHNQRIKQLISGGLSERCAERHAAQPPEGTTRPSRSGRGRRALRPRPVLILPQAGRRAAV